VDGDVGTRVVLGIAGAQVLDRPDRGDDPAEQGGGRQRYVQVEDLLDEPLVGVLRGAEERKREAGPQHEHGRDGEAAKRYRSERIGHSMVPG
jgi:hypothetical protein